MPTLGEQLVRWLEAYGVTHVFGIPGVHTVEMYRGLAASGLRHVTPRHEQGAGFMADGFARVTGRPGVAFVITGPGLANTLTAMGQAKADSVPMLVVSSVTRQRALGQGNGELHEIARQGAMAEHAAAFSCTLSHPAQLADTLARAWAVFEGARPMPVHVEIPVDLFSADVPDEAPERVARLHRPAAAESAVAAAAEMLDQAARPLILAGGGAVTGAGTIADLARRLGAPVVMTTNARGLLGSDDPLAVPASPSLQAVRALIAEADALLAIGTEIGQTDCDMLETGLPTMPGALARIDIDPAQLHRNARAAVPLLGDAGATAEALARRAGRPRDGGAERAARTMTAAREELDAGYRRTVALLEAVRDALPEAPLVGDSTQMAYAGNLLYAAPAPRRWFNAATGFGALGYGLPAAVGAAVATGDPVVCLAGDGGLQFTLAELGTAVEERLPVIVLVWNNRGYGEIRRYMTARGIEPVGVDLHTPDFVQLARGYGAAAVGLDDLDALPDRLREAAGRAGPTLIVFDERVVLGDVDP